MTEPALYRRASRSCVIAKSLTTVQAAFRFCEKVSSMSFSASWSSLFTSSCSLSRRSFCSGLWAVDGRCTRQLDYPVRLNNLHWRAWDVMGWGNMSDWYVNSEGREDGPFDLPAVVAYLRAIEPAQVYVWRAGLDEWKLIQDVPELACCTRSQPSKRETVSTAPESKIEPRQFDHGLFAKKYKFSWAKIGAGIGLVACFADLVFEWSGRTFEAWDTASGPAYNFGYIASCVGLPAFIGFILGTIRDALGPTPTGQWHSQ
jgi:hypothetical protein